MLNKQSENTRTGKNLDAKIQRCSELSAKIMRNLRIMKELDEKRSEDIPKSCSEGQ